MTTHRAAAWALPVIIALLVGLGCDDPVQIVQHEPVIQSITLDRTIVYVRETVTVKAVVTDEDDDELTYQWTAPSGSFINAQNPQTQWRAPASPDTVVLSLTVSDGTFTVSDQARVIVRTP